MLLRKRSSSTGKEIKLQHHPQKNLSAQPVHQLKVLTLLFIWLTFRPPLNLALTPAQVHNAPGLGPDCMPWIPAAWVYSRSEACQQRAHEESSSCRVKLLVMSRWYFHIPDRHWVWIWDVARSGERHRYGCNWCVNVSRVCARVCVYHLKTIAMCSALGCMGFFVRYALHKGHVSSCITALSTFSFWSTADTTSTAV